MPLPEVSKKDVENAADAVADILGVLVNPAVGEIARETGDALSAIWSMVEKAVKAGKVKRVEAEGETHSAELF